MASEYVLHVYDHCPYCNRVELFMDHFKLSFKRVVYGYGQGADPTACGGTGYGPTEGPIKLTGKKVLPVLEGKGVPTQGDQKGMPESMEIIAFLTGEHKLVAPCASGREDLAGFMKALSEVAPLLFRPRFIKMPVADWTDEQDIAYAKWKYTTKMNFDYAAAEAKSSELISRVSELLKMFEPMIKGGDMLNIWGWGIDDVVVMPTLRGLQCVKGIEYPPGVAAYIKANLEGMHVADYAAHAC